MVLQDLIASRQRAPHWPFQQWYRLVPLTRSSFIESVQTFIQLCKSENIQPDFSLYVARINEACWPISELNDVKKTLATIQDEYGTETARLFIDHVASILPKPKTWADIEATLQCIVQMPTSAKRYEAIDRMVHGNVRRLMDLPPKCSLRLVSAIFADIVDLKCEGNLDLSCRFQKYMFFNAYQHLYKQSFFTEKEHQDFSCYVQEHAKGMTWMKDGNATYYWPYIQLFGIDPFASSYFHSTLIDMTVNQASSLLQRFQQEDNHDRCKELALFVVKHAHFTSGIEDTLYWPCLDIAKNYISEFDNDTRKKILLGFSFREAYLQGLISQIYSFQALGYGGFINNEDYENYSTDWQYNTTFKAKRLHHSPVALAMGKLSSVDIDMAGALLDINLYRYDTKTFFSEIDIYHGMLMSIAQKELPDGLELDISSLI